MIYKIKIKDKESGEIDYVIMGDSYKGFRDHFQDVISHWTEKWHYASEDKHAECFGRTINKEILTIYSSTDRFVSFGGLKMCYQENYDEKVEGHNKSGNSDACKRLGEINWNGESAKFIQTLLKQNRVISEEQLNNAQTKSSEVKR